MVILSAGWPDGGFTLVDIAPGGGSGAYYERITNRHSGLVADVDQHSTADDGNVRQWTCTGAHNQQWQVVRTGSFAELRARHSGKCLDVHASSTADGGNIQQWTCTGAGNQQWSFAAA